MAAESDRPRCEARLAVWPGDGGCRMVSAGPQRMPKGEPIKRGGPERAEAAVVIRRPLHSESHAERPVISDCPQLPWILAART
ncbi:hypothetical protein NDU88_002435 [Pleurodeles waltl]|uniref:Uncharacterized protein n=1 Tax=Pleurodeles waltl TaxID=8319 RepID=A0AAV7RFK3_PLEWA|nr:hypothetical protein NDU88_002435 [Pleurodeles waltl]